MGKIKGFLVLAGGLIRSLIDGFYKRSCKLVITVCLRGRCRAEQWKYTIKFVITCAVLIAVCMWLKGCVIDRDGLIIGEIDCDHQALCEEG